MSEFLRPTLFALAAYLCTGAAWAASTPTTVSVYLQMMDGNGDGRVSLAEYQQYMSRGFHRVDRNGDDVIERSELPPGSHRPAGVTLAQYLDNVAAVFRRQDRNHDGHLDGRELAAPPR